MAQMNSNIPPAPGPSYPFLHNCLTCGHSFRSELALFDHNLTREHQAAIEKKEDDRRHPVSPPVHSRPASRDQTSSSSSSKRSGIKKRSKHRHHKNRYFNTQHHNSDKHHTTLTPHTPFNHSTPEPSYQGSELHNSRAAQFHTHNSDHPMSRKHSCSSVESSTSNSSIPGIQYTNDDERRRSKKRKWSHREKSRSTTPPLPKHQAAGSRKPYWHNSFGGHFALPEVMRNIKSGDPPVHTCIKGEDVVSNVNAIETSSVSSGDFSEFGCEVTHTKNEEAKNQSATSSKRPYSPVSDDESTCVKSSNRAQTENSSTNFSLNDLIPPSETFPTIHVGHQTGVHPVCTSATTATEIHVHLPVCTATADSLICGGTIACTSAAPIVRTTDTSFTVNSPCINFPAKNCETEKPLTAVVTSVNETANLKPAVCSPASKGRAKPSCGSKISKQKSPVRNKHSSSPKKHKSTNSPILNKTGKVKNLMSKVMENSLLVPLSNPRTPQIRLPDIPLIGMEHSFQPFSSFAAEQSAFQPKISTVESAKDHVLSQLVGAVMSSPSSTSSLLPSKMCTTSCSAATLSLLQPDVLKQLSGLSSPSVNGLSTPGKTLKEELTDPSANEKSVPANCSLLSALDSTEDIQPQLKQEESSGFIVKSEPSDFVLDHTHTTPPCTSPLPLSNVPPPHTATTQSTVSQRSITTLSDSNNRPILFGDPQHSKNNPTKLVDSGSRTDLTNRNAEISLSNKPKNRKRPRKNSQQTHKKKSSCPTQDKQRSSSNGDANNHDAAQSGPKGGCQNDLNTSNDVGSKKKPQLKDGTKSPTAKKAKLGDRSPTPSSGGDLSLLSSSVEALNNQEKKIQEDLIALQKSKSEISLLKIEQTKTLEELETELQKLQHELATVMANVIAKEKALSDQNKVIEDTKNIEEDLAKKEKCLAQSYKNVLKRKEDFFLPNASTTKQPNPKYKSNPNAVNDKPKPCASNAHRKSQSSEKSRTTCTSKNARKNSTTISNARSLDTVVTSSCDTSKTVVTTSTAVLNKIDRLVKSVSSAKKVLANVNGKDQHATTKVTTTCTSSNNNCTITGVSSSQVAPTSSIQQNDSVVSVDNLPTVATVSNSESIVVAVDNSSNHSLTNTAQNIKSPGLDEASTSEQVSLNTDTTPSAESMAVVDSQGGCADSVDDQIGSVMLTPHRQSILCLKVCGDYLFSGSSDHSLHVYKLTTGELVIRLPSYHERAINSIAVYEQEGTLYLITGSSDKMVHMYNVEKRKQVAQFSIGDHVTCVVVTGDLLIIAVVSGGVKIVDLSAKKEFLNLKQIHKSRISNMCVHQHLLVTGSFDNLVSVWDIRQTFGKDRSALKSVKALALPQTPLCVKIHGNHLFIGCGDGQLYIYSTQDWTMSRKLEHKTPVTCVDVMGGVLITGGFDKRIRCYDIKTFQLLQLYCFESRIFCVCAANSKIVAGLENGSLECVQLNLTNFYTCEWKDCELKFGALQHLTTYHLSDHVNSEEKLSTKCEWRDCTQVLNPSELLAHLKKHARQ